MPNRKQTQSGVGEIQIPILLKMLIHFYEDEKLLHSKTQIKNSKIQNSINHC